MGNGDVWTQPLGTIVCNGFHALDWSISRAAVAALHGRETRASILRGVKGSKLREKQALIREAEDTRNTNLQSVVMILWT